MFWSGERNPFPTSKKYKIKETVENALEGIYQTEDQGENTYNL